MDLKQIQFQSVAVTQQMTERQGKLLMDSRRNVKIAFTFYSSNFQKKQNENEKKQNIIYIIIENTLP